MGCVFAEVLFDSLGLLSLHCKMNTLASFTSKTLGTVKWRDLSSECFPEAIPALHSKPL